MGHTSHIVSPNTRADTEHRMIEVEKFRMDKQMRAEEEEIEERNIRARIEELRRDNERRMASIRGKGESIAFMDQAIHALQSRSVRFESSGLRPASSERLFGGPGSRANVSGGPGSSQSQFGGPAASARSQFDSTCPVRRRCD